MKQKKPKLSNCILIFMLASVLLFASCGGPKKCNGSKGTRTEMGTM